MNLIEKKIQQYIETELPKSIRFHKEDDGTLIGLPYPYSTPCSTDSFQEMYYWDTYFTNKGLIATGNVEQAINNANNMFFLIERYGYVLNGNRTFYVSNSQPPFLSLMVRDIFNATSDKEWLKTAVSALEKEYSFWMTKRLLDCGLNHYSNMPIAESRIKRLGQILIERIRIDPQGRTDEELASSLISSGESGWDLNPRMTIDTPKYAPIDLNSLLYALEGNLEHYFEILGNSQKQELYKQKKLARAELCNQYLKSDSGIFNDYNWVENQKNSLITAASFYPLYCGLATKEDADITIKLCLPKLETEHGILTCEENDVDGIYQWDYPNGWAPLQLIVVGGLINYGYHEDAMRIAKSFVNTVENSFEKTGNLWEKYNVLTGSADAKSENSANFMPTMLGWTFGVYTVFKNLLNGTIGSMKL